MVDSIFIGQGVGPLAISGLAVTFPFMNLSAAFGAAVGVGASSYISVKLGQKDYEKAQHVFGNTVTLNVIIGIVFTHKKTERKNLSHYSKKRLAKKIILRK